MIQNMPDARQQFAEAQQRYAEMACTAQERMCQYIEENPKGSVLLGLGVGFGAGLFLASLLRNSTDYFAPEEKSFAERISHQVADSLATVLPQAWKNRFQS